MAVATAGSDAPPDPTTPTSAYWDAPVNIAKERTQLCSTESPAAGATAPKDRAYAPVAMPIPTALRRTPARVLGHADVVSSIAPTLAVGMGVRAGAGPDGCGCMA